MKRILFLLTQDLNSPSGLGRYWPLARQLARLGHVVRIAALHANWAEMAHRVEEIDAVRIEYVAPMHVKKQGNTKTYYSPPRLIWVALRATLALTWAALSQPADIIIVGKPHPMNGLAGLAGRFLRGRTLILDCDDDESGSSRFSTQWQRGIVGWFERFLPRRAARVTANTFHTLERLKTLGVPAERLVYVPNGVDSARFAPVDEGELAQLRQRWQLEGERLVLYLGSLSQPSHPVDLLVRAFAQLLPGMPAAHLLVVGGGEDLPNLQSLAAELNLGAHVTFTGRVTAEEAPLYYHLAEVSVDPVHDDLSARGRCPLKLFESWAAGTPFVTAAVGDRPRLAGNPPAVLLTEPGSVPALAAALEQVLTSPHLAAELRQNGLHQAEKFTWERIAADFNTVVKQHDR